MPHNEGGRPETSKSLREHEARTEMKDRVGRRKKKREKEREREREREREQRERCGVKFARLICAAISPAHFRGSKTKQVHPADISTAVFFYERSRAGGQICFT